MDIHYLIIVKIMNYGDNNNDDVDNYQNPWNGALLTDKIKGKKVKIFLCLID
jgi:hypothetical protein